MKWQYSNLSNNKQHFRWARPRSLLVNVVGGLDEIHEHQVTTNDNHRATVRQSSCSVLYTQCLLLPTTLWGGRHYFYPHPRDKDTQTQRG